MKQLNKRILERMAHDRYCQIKKHQNNILEKKLRSCKNKFQEEELISFHDEIIKNAWDDYLKIKRLK